MPSTGVLNAAPRILVVEDEALIAEEICDRLSQHGYEMLGVVDTGAAAIESALARRPDRAATGHADLLQRLTDDPRLERADIGGNVR